MYYVTNTYRVKLKKNIIIVLFLGDSQCEQSNKNSLHRGLNMRMLCIY